MEMLHDLLKRRGWKQQRRARSLAGSRLEAWAAGAHHCTLYVQQAPDSRPETVRGRLALALLDAQAPAAQQPSAGVVLVPRLSRAVLEKLAQVAALAPGCGWGAIGDNGRAVLHLAGFDETREPRPGERGRRVDPVAADPFSDLGLWVTKVLIKRTMADASRDWNTWVTGPSTYFGSYEAFADSVQVSTKTAWQTIHALDGMGFVAGAAAAVPLVRVRDLLQRIRGATRDPTRRWSCRWLLPRHDSLQRLLAGRLVIETGFHHGTRARWREGARVCLAGFAAARAHGLLVTNAHQPEVHVDADVELGDLGLVAVAPGERADIVVTRARRPHAVFRAAVVKDDLPCADIIQTWLDVVDHPLRGREQASRLWEAMFG